jgi:hypothetical protein
MLSCTTMLRQLMHTTAHHSWCAGPSWPRLGKLAGPWPARPPTSRWIIHCSATCTAQAAARHSKHCWGHNLLSGIAGIHKLQHAALCLVPKHTSTSAACILMRPSIPILSGHVICSSTTQLLVNSTAASLSAPGPACNQQVVRPKSMYACTTLCCLGRWHFPNCLYCLFE